MTQPTLFDDGDLPIALRPPQAFRRLPQRIEPDYCCPRCGYEWKGKPMPTTADADADLGE